MALRDRAPGRWMVVVILVASLDDLARRSAVADEEERRQRRQRHGGRAGLSVPRLRHRLDTAEIAHARAAIDRRIGVQPLAPAAAARQPDPVALARDRREV